MEWSFIWFLVIIFTWSYFHIIIHETGHAVVGNWLGYQVRSVIIGGGPKLFSINFGQTVYDFHLWPNGGLAQASNVPDLSVKIKPILYYAGGIIADSILLALVTYFYFANYDQLPELARIGGIAIMVNQAIAILVSACPCEVTDCRGVPGYNDGKQIAYALKGERPPLHPKITKHYLAAVQRYDPTFQEKDIAISHLSPDLLSQYLGADLALRKGHLSEAMAGFQAVVTNGALHPGEIAYLHDTITTQVLIDRPPDLLEPALAMAHEALERAPMATTMKGTIGGLNVELGRYREGLVYLLPLTSESHEPVNRAISALYVAKAFRALEDEASAQRFLTLRKEIKYHDSLTQRLDQELAIRHRYR